MHLELDHLNPEQRAAVLATEGPVLLLAGAGSGKTRVLTQRIAHLVQDCGVHPSEILAVTFTNKAAREMKNRVFRLLGPSAMDVWVSTFHSACVRILRRHIERIGRDRNFVIYDDKEQMDVIKRVVLSLDLDPDFYKPQAVRAYIDKAKNEGHTPDAFRKLAMSSFDEQIPHIYAAYQQELNRNNAMDFGDLLLQVLTLFAEAPDVLEHYRDSLRYFMVDEYQDTNRAQYLLVKLLAAKHTNLCVVGDDDQSIYSWRGADIRNILEFNRDYPNATIVKLEQNYRSTKNILDTAYQVVSRNQNRSDKRIWTNNPPGDKLAIYTAEDDLDESRFVMEQIRKLHASGMRYSEIAIMYRMNSLSRVFEDNLLKASIPYQIVGGMKFYDRKEIKDAVAMLRLLLNPFDFASFQRVISNFTAGIGKTSIDRVVEYARNAGMDLVSAAKAAPENKAVGGAARPKLLAFSAVLQELNTELANYGIREFTFFMLNRTGYLEGLKRQATEEALSRLDNLGELLNSMEEFEEANAEARLEDYLDQVALVADVDSRDDEVDKLTLMTLHSAKGLEYPAVFLVGLEQNIFPHSRSQGDIQELEEERRLCYVGITRAEKRLFISHAKRRRMWGSYEMFQPSQFLSDFPEECTLRIGPPKPAWLDKPTTGRFSTAATMYAQPSAPADPVVRQEDSKVGKFSQGCKVSHPTFGTGLVVYVDGTADNPKLTVKFDRAGVKKIMARFVPLEVVG